MAQDVESFSLMDWLRQLSDWPIRRWLIEVGCAASIPRLKLGWTLAFLWSRRF